MADDIDATDLRQAVLDAANIAAHVAAAAATKIEGDGDCIVCSNPVQPVVVNGKSIIGRWCCIECRDRTGL